MEVLRTVTDVRNFVENQKKQGKKIGLVPTMGALHDGHLTLGREAKKHCDILIYSIFVNPTQFGPNEDLDKYPRDFEGDENKLSSIGVDAVFYPTSDVMYPEGYKTYVKVRDLSNILCGESRTNHFEGVTTVVLKLFNITKTDCAFFGKKDFQQFAIIKKMCNDLNVDIELYPVDIVRESDGLAMSSRNAYLNENERKAAVVLSKSLKQAVDKINSYKDCNELISDVTETIKSEPLANIEYVEFRKADDLSKASDLNDENVILLAVRFGNTRLIDNMVVKKGQ